MYKNDMRERYKALRASLSTEERSKKDAAIMAHVMAMPAYEQCKTFLCYVSMPREAATHHLIKAALSQKKKVAVPYCVAGTRLMRFYAIESVDELIPGSFGVLEPDPQLGKRVGEYDDAFCIVPGLVFDRHGYRLGYGGGYYDRFLLNDYSGVTAGICYQICTVPRIKRGRYDMACDYVVTENGFQKSAGIRRQKR
ncbi:MAG: 5-formyltetrahydrofolate cyclo-ligase [Oscillospiraceae bacterium]|nr:5-formyltetrahydrofolate cyclo-ligase [Oscillospiraceae bacterium]